LYTKVSGDGDGRCACEVQEFGSPHFRSLDG
jgi:hypothetical protein